MGKYDNPDGTFNEEAFLLESIRATQRAAKGPGLFDSEVKTLKDHEKELKCLLKEERKKNRR